MGWARALGTSWARIWHGLGTSSGTSWAESDPRHPHTPNYPGCPGGGWGLGMGPPPTERKFDHRSEDCADRPLEARNVGSHDRLGTVWVAVADRLEELAMLADRVVEPLHPVERQEPDP